ncbi:phospho-acceptor domain-containing protein [Tenacibaculum adriaticum]|uniref:histidine kinase n=1 Tax=Tenacibaculum adriaticum TaxID=413713 RepID=A0A5S5DLA6_9FLAO|nr:ATP-binding protein [Tenacibaculum adriaticum]TYP96710.1 phospho-acceptor domain-containing protein [Tenacibaculum adriaticum]
MNSLLERQIRKYLAPQEKASLDLTEFINAIDRSYENYEDQQKMIQRAMIISSEELFEANQKLQGEAIRQSKVIEKLKDVINTLGLYQLPKDQKREEIELDVEKLAKFIDNQAKQIVEANNQKERLLENLEKQNQELNEYAHIVSHDLKSPLRIIDTVTNWLIEDYKDVMNNECQGNLQLILNNVEKMDSLICDILDYSTIDKAETNIYDVDLQHLVTEIINIIHIPAHINVKIIETLPIVKGDKFRLQQLFQNLLINAVNYIDKPKGKVEVGVEERNGFWQFYIRDNGKGIPEMYYEKIFKVFQKLENNEKSTGIGLAIVKKIIDYYGGSISLDSQINKGTTFYFTLPK